MVSHVRGTAAPASVIKIHGVLRNALADAEWMDLVPRNVAKAVRSASLTRTERRALTPAEATVLLSQLQGDRPEGVFVVALSTGLRRGVVLGLRWHDIDLPGRTLFVRQTVQRINGELRFVPPRTHRSTRWAGAGAGAVITWLTDLAANPPPRPAAEPEDSRSATLRLRAQRAAERLASAAPGSPSRRQAQELAAGFTRRARTGQSRNRQAST